MIIQRLNLICSHDFHVIVDIVVRQKFKHVVRIAMESTGRDEESESENLLTSWREQLCYCSCYHL